MGRSGKKWRPLKEKPGKLDEWPEGWGDGLDDLSPCSSLCIILAIYPSSDKRVDNGQPKPDLSLRAEAQNTERRHQQQRSSTPRISREPMQFISVGQMNLDQSFKKLQVETPSTPLINLGGFSQGGPISRLNMQELQPAQSPELTSSSDQKGEIVPDAGKKKDHTSGATQSEVNNGLFFTDTIGTQQPVTTGFAQPIVRPNSPCLSDSSDEVIVFAGRGLAGGAPLVKQSFSQDCDRSLQGAHSTTSQGVAITEDPVDLSALADSRDMGSTGAVPEALDGLNHNTQGKKPKERNGKMKEMLLQDQALEEEAIADYIAHIDPTDSFPNTTNRAKNLGNENVHETDNAGEHRDKAIDIFGQQNDFPKDLKYSGDLNGLKVTEILSKRHNLSGAQHLVVENGSSAAPAPWISADYLKSASAEHHVGTFESKQLEDEAGSTGSNDSRSGESQGRIAVDVQDAPNDEMNKQALWDRQVEGMTDEEIARLLSRQEELGLGSNEMLILDFNEEGDGLAFVVSEKKTSSDARRRGNKLNQPGNNLSYPNEASNAKKHGNYDIMDLNRPSLRRQPKGRSRVAALGLDDDPELGSKMEVLWENDRSKKKIRKQEREELRAQGLLGQKSKDNATPEITSDEIKSAIREFLLSSSER